MFKKTIIFTVVISILLFALQLTVVTPVYAVNVPSFAVCTNPQGTIKVSYPSGTHGIPSRTDTFNGSDTVYQLTNDTLMQCFCAVDGRGIQTNWWKVSSLNQDEIEVLKSQGWSFIPNGALWGLDEAPYMAINADYSCQGSSSTSSSSPSSPSVLASATNVLGLASTGNNLLPYALMTIGIISLLLAILLRKKYQH